MKLKLSILSAFFILQFCGFAEFASITEAQEASETPQADEPQPAPTAEPNAAQPGNNYDALPNPMSDPEAIAAAEKLAMPLQEVGKQNPNLYGVLVTADEDVKSPLQVNVELIVDEQQGSVDQKPFAAVLDAQLEEAQYNLKTTKHPAKKLLAEIQEGVAGNSSLGNIQITGIRYVADQNIGLTLKLQGFRSKSTSADDGDQRNQQLGTLTEIVAAAIAKVYEGTDLNTPNPSVTDVEDVEPPSESEMQLAQQLQDLLDSEADRFPQIFGSHVSVRREFSSEEVRYPVVLVVDESTPLSTVPPELLQLAADVVPEDAIEASMQQHPVQLVLAQINDRVAQNENLSDVDIERIRYGKGDDVNFRTPPAPWMVSLIGTLPQTSLRDPLKNLSDEVLRNVYEARDAVPPTAAPESMRLQLPPVEDFLMQLAQRIANEKALTGARVTQAGYTDPEQNPVLLLENGQIAHSGQNDPLTNAASVVLKEMTNDDPETPAVQISDDVVTEFLSADPFARELQDRVEIHPDLGGCAVYGAEYIKADDGSEVLQVTARISRAEQRDTLTQLGIDLVDEWYGKSWPRVQLKAEEVRPSRLVAAKMMDMGMNLYRCGNYHGAHRAFSRAILEAPESLASKYWQIVTEITLGQQHDAYRHIRPLVARQREEDNAFIREYQNMLDSLENVQGSTRMTLQLMENKASFELPPPINQDEQI